MEKLLTKFLKAPWIVMSVIILISALFFMQMKSKSRMETDLDEYMPKEHPAFMYSDQAEEWFGINDGIIIDDMIFCILTFLLFFVVNL